MFNIDHEPTFSTIATALVPHEGGAQEESFGVTFRVMEVGEYESADLGSGAAVSTLLKKLIVNLEDIVGADGKALKYSDQLRDRLLGWPHARQALMKAYLEGLNEALAGN